MPKLTIHLPGQEPLKIGFDDQVEISLGRADDNDIVLQHESISSHHAQLRLVGGAYHLLDLGSTNGTFLEGEPVTEAPLAHGASITFGQVPADYEAAEEEEAHAPEGDDGFASSGGSGFESAVHGAVAEHSVLPANFRNLSPLPQAEKKDVFAQAAMALGIVGILAAAALVGFAMMMQI